MKLQDIVNKEIRLVGMKLLLNCNETLRDNLIQLCRLNQGKLTEDNINDFFYGSISALKRDSAVLDREVRLEVQNGKH